VTPGDPRSGDGRAQPGAPPADLLLVHGDDHHRVDEAVRQWRRRAAAAELGVEVIEAPAPLERVRSSLAETPLIDERRYLLLRDPPQLTGGRRSGEGGRALADALLLRAPSTSVCLVSHQAVPASHPVVVAVGRLGGEIRAFKLLRGREVREWAERAVADRGLRLRAGALDHLLRVAGSDLGVIAAELDKLSAFSGGEPVDVEAARRLVGGAEAVEVWNVLERLLGVQPGRGAAAATELVEEGHSTQHLIATLAGQLSELRRAQSLLGTGGSGGRLATELRIPEWRADRLARQARAVAPAVVEDWLHQLQAIDAAIKSGETDDRLLVAGSAGRRGPLGSAGRLCCRTRLGRRSLDRRSLDRAGRGLGRGCLLGTGALGCSGGLGGRGRCRLARPALGSSGGGRACDRLLRLTPAHDGELRRHRHDPGLAPRRVVAVKDALLGSLVQRFDRRAKLFLDTGDLAAHERAAHPADSGPDCRAYDAVTDALALTGADALPGGARVGQDDTC